ncbi:MAG: TraR/DksA family transcriptional regulator [Fibrobacterota bacterium]
MTKAERKQLKKAVQEQIAELGEDIIALKEASKPVSPDQSLGRLTRMDAIASKSVNEAGLAKALQVMHRLEEILPKIDEPDFGLCARCGGEIPYERLEIFPYTSRCTRCL